MVCPNCSTVISEKDLMCNNCGEIIKELEDIIEIDYDKDAKFIETVDESELDDISMVFEDEDFDEYIPLNEDITEVKKLFNSYEKKSKKNLTDTEDEFYDDLENLMEVIAEDEEYEIDAVLSDDIEDEIIEENLETAEKNHELNVTEDLNEEPLKESKNSTSNDDGMKDYINLNFFSQEKLVELVSKDVISEKAARLVEESKDEMEKILVSFDDSIENLFENLSVSNEELTKRIADSANTHQIHLEKIEREKKEAIEKFYKQYRITLLLFVKRTIIFIVIVANFLMIYDLATNNFSKISSQLYAEDMVERYDRVTWDNIEYIIVLDKILVRGVQRFANNEITSEELAEIAKNHIKEIDGRNQMFFLPVYDEAEEYLFVASKLAFTSQYLSETIIDYFESGNVSYHVRYKEASVKLEQFYEEVEIERIKFLRNMGLSFEKIEKIVGKNNLAYNSNVKAKKKL